MKIAELGGFELHMPTSGGKAGKGCNKTSTLQVRHDNMIVKQFRFTLNDPASRAIALHKARMCMSLMSSVCSDCGCKHGCLCE